MNMTDKIQMYNKQYKKNAEEAMDNILLNTVGCESDFIDYKDETLNWSWDNIVEGD